MSRLPPPPDLDWTPAGPPRARGFDDIYFSAAGGLAETQAVFLAGCGLPEGWRGRARFAIGELGFGAGLNALATWEAWRRARAPGAWLHYVSTEAFPMDAVDAARAHAAFPELAALSRKLIAAWPARAYAPQRLIFPEDGFALTLFIGAAEDSLAQIDGRFDAWFLDGFAPARNPAMWSETLFRRIAALSAPGARAATYSVAGAVRRGLEAAGFSVSKEKGFGRKSERLEARFLGAGRAATVAPRTVAIIGGGVAGAAMSAALTRRGAEVAIYEAAPELGAGASGAPAGIVMPRLDRARGPLQELHVAAFLHAVAAYRALGIYAPCVLEEAGRDDLAADPPLPPDWLAPEGAIALHLQTGLVRAQDAIAAWTRDADIVRDARIDAIACGETGVTVNGRTFDAAILATGARLNATAQTAWLDLRLTAGQMESASFTGDALAHGRIGKSYAAPFRGRLIFGATFERGGEARVTAEARALNLDHLAALAPDWAARIDETDMVSFAGVRAAAPDYAPILGAAPDAAAWFTKPAYHRGLHLFGALSARGLTLSPLLAETLASELFGEPAPLSLDSRAAAHPARFLHRMLKRGLTLPAD